MRRAMVVYCCLAAMACGQQSLFGLRENVHARRFHRLCAWAAVCNADFLLLASVSYRLALDPSGPAEVLQSTAGLTQVNQRSNSSADRYIDRRGAEAAAPIPAPVKIA